MKSRETLLIKGTLTAGAGQIEGVMAKLVLPVPPFTKPTLELRPESAHQASAIVHAFQGRFEAERPITMSGEGLQSVRCDNVYFLQANTRNWSHDIKISRIKCDAGNVCVSSDRHPESKPESCHVVFWLTPHRHLRSAAIMGTSFDGTSTREVRWQQNIPLLPGIQLVIDQEFSWNTKKSGRTIRDSCKVARCEVPFDAHDPKRLMDEIVPALDDFLTFASLAGSWRCVCTGWQVSDSSGRTTTYYRGNITRPKQKKADALDTGLIPLEHFDKFVQECWPRWTQSPFHDALRTISYSVIAGRSRTLESRYVSMYAAFETAVLAYRRQHNLEFTLPPDLWSGLNKALRKSIKDFNPSLTSEQRSMLYDGLSGLRRVSLRRAWEQWLGELNCSLGDLWPVYDPGSRAGLSVIRNKLVHGDFGSGGHFGALFVAADHLRWLLERLALSILGWDVKRSEVRPRFLAHLATSMLQLDEARREMDALRK